MQEIQYTATADLHETTKCWECGLYFCSEESMACPRCVKRITLKQKVEEKNI